MDISNLWLVFIIATNFFSAAVVLMDRYLVTSPTMIKPAVYAFYIGFLSIAAILVLPFGLVSKPTPAIVGLALITAVSYVLFILFFYKSLKLGHASDVAPATGAAAAISTLVFSFLILGDKLPPNFIPGLILLVGGTLFLSHLRFSRRVTLWVIAGGFFFGLSSVLVKALFNATPFWNAFFWSRIANVFGAFLLLAWPGNLKATVQSLKQSSIGTKTLVVFNKGLGGLAFLLFLAAVKLGDVSLTNALGGVQFAFLLVFALAFGRKFPEYFSENVHHRHEIFHKIFATSAIVVGFFILFR